MPWRAAARAGRRFPTPSAESAWSLYRASACQTCVVSWRQLWSDDVDSIRAKVGFEASLAGASAGVGIWALG